MDNNNITIVEGLLKKKRVRVRSGLTVDAYTPQEVWQFRADNYVYHRERREWAQLQAEETRTYAINVCNNLIPPGLNHFGNWDERYFEGDNWSRMHPAARMIGLNATDFTIWYWTEEGWKQFVRKFNELPDPKYSTALVDNSGDKYPQPVSNQAVVHISTGYVERS